MVATQFLCKSEARRDLVDADYGFAVAVFGGL